MKYGVWIGPKPLVSRRSRCRCRRGFLKLPSFYDSDGAWKRSTTSKGLFLRCVDNVSRYEAFVRFFFFFFFSLAFSFRNLREYLLVVYLNSFRQKHILIRTALDADWIWRHLMIKCHGQDSCCWTAACSNTARRSGLWLICHCFCVRTSGWEWPVGRFLWQRKKCVNI